MMKKVDRMNRRASARQMKQEERGGIGVFLLSQLNRVVFVLLMAMILHMLPIHNHSLPSSASVTTSTEDQITNPTPQTTSIQNRSILPNSDQVAGSLQPSATSAQTEAPATKDSGTVNWVRMKGTTEIRTEPDPSKPDLLIVTANEALPVLQQTGDWIEVGLNTDQRGWIRKSEATTISVPAADTQLLKVNKNTSVYLGPDESFDQAYRLKATASFIPKMVSGKWIEVAEQKDGKPLWVPTSQAIWTYGEQPAIEAWSQDVQALSSAAKLKQKLPLEGKTIVVDPGHGGSDPGAIASGKPVYERDINLAAAQVLANKLKSAGANVIMTRTSNDQTVSLAQRVQISNDNKADVFVSIHQNMYQQDPSVSGTITYYESPNSKQLAEKIETATTGQLSSKQGQQNEQIEKEQLYVLKHNTRPAVLIEGCFLSNPSELNASLLPSYHEKLAAGIYQGIFSYLHA
ncbi:N-acetylmuramoyl-L-alanine amidase [Gordoniibacillus kamchatkensis]|uniref:N-acetylmuramoyl-L-alanine amidase n=1 Tax=Gordoniibacillus kamchatkensis TaxID=1590651 RepID=UPI0006977934|nr:N-acetylmuramoyl-L-alanine amidase [Paenibacillus sp. VKM B-2647]